MHLNETTKTFFSSQENSKITFLHEIIKTGRYHKLLPLNISDDTPSDSAKILSAGHK